MHTRQHYQLPNENKKVAETSSNYDRQSLANKQKSNTNVYSEMLHNQIQKWKE